MVGQPHDPLLNRVNEIEWFKNSNANYTNAHGVIT